MNSRIATKILLWVLILSTGKGFAGEVSMGRSTLAPQLPRYELTLNLKEFSVLSSAARLGVGKYGGSAEFQVKLAKQGEDVIWTITITNPRLIEMWEYWMAEKTAELVDLLDFDNLDAAGKSALETVKSVNAKIAQARANPIWDPVKLSGLVVEKDRKWFIQTEDRKYLVTGDKLSNIKPMKDKPVVATGFVKVRDQFELSHFIEKKQNALEMFVMSFCPFSKRAEGSIIEFLETFSAEIKPSLEIRYIFYKKSQDGKTVFTSLHGEKEVNENVLQMVIRDTHPEFYYKYLLQRAKSNARWDKLARKIGMTEESIKFIENMTKEERENLIRDEYEYVTGRYQIYDRSPTYVWESELVTNLREIKAFNDLEFSFEICEEAL